MVEHTLKFLSVSKNIAFYPQTAFLNFLHEIQSRALYIFSLFLLLILMQLNFFKLSCKAGFLVLPLWTFNCFFPPPCFSNLRLNQILCFVLIATAPSASTSHLSCSCTVSLLHCHTSCCSEHVYHVDFLTFSNFSSKFTTYFHIRIPSSMFPSSLLPPEKQTLLHAIFNQISLIQESICHEKQLV